ncbi:MAG TPA: hypothetical protein VFW85_01715 [Gaiellaceae bacterium]|nr:hypothetical protein [Gaiellaceae bacterium]
MQAESLKSCVGFTVESHDRRLGVVETVLFGSDAPEPEALTVRGGRFKRGVRVFDAADIVGIDARSRRINVRGDGIAIRF